MVKHIVMWKFKDSLTEVEKEVAKNKIKNDLEALKGKIDGLNSLEVGINYANGGYDLCLVTEFPTKEALDFYQNFPEHVKCKAYIGTVTAERGFSDYES